MIQWLKTWKYVLLAGAFVSIALGSFVAVYVNTEKTVYTWDFANYWRPAIDLSHQIENEPRAALKTIVDRTRNDEYNVLHATPPAIWMLIFGTSRMSYILSLYILYFLPATILMAAVAYNLIKRLLNKAKASKKAWIAFALWVLVLLNPVILGQLLRGYPDIVGLGLIALAVLIYIRYRQSLAMRWLLVIAVVLVLATLLRRWYIFGAVGLIIGMGIDQLVLIFRKNSRWGSRIVNTLKLAILPFTYIALFVGVAFPYVMHLLSTNYSANYSAYQRHDSYFELGWFTIEHFSILFLILAVISLGWLAWKKYNRGVIGVILISALFSFFAVGRVQSFDPHQYYLLTLPVVVGVAVFPFVVTAMVVKKKKVITLGVSLAVCALLFSLNSYSVYATPLKASPVLTKLQFSPMVSSDLDEVKQMYQYVSSLGSDKRIYVLSCSNTFNIDTFRNVPLSMSGVTPINYDNYVFTTQLDTRDGFNLGFFDADVVIDTDPIGYIAARDQQQIITYLHQEIRDGILKPYYKQTYSYDMKTYGAVVHERIEEIPEEVRQEILEKVKSTHENVKIFTAVTPYG